MTVVSVRVRPCDLPEDALLQAYRRTGAYTDSFVAQLPVSVPFSDYVSAFYTTALFKLERLILEWAVARPSSDSQAAQLAAGTLDQFAAWILEQRDDQQMLLTDYRGRTRSWLMTRQISAPAGPHTRLYFGSAVVPQARTAPQAVLRRPASRVLLGFHRAYSRMLLKAAAEQVLKTISR